MIWAILALLGVPLWLCVLGILALLYRNRALRQRPGNIPVRVQRAGKTRWARGYAVWVSDVFAWRGIPAGWGEELLHVSAADVETLGPEELKKLHRLGDNPSVVTLTPTVGQPVRVAVASEHRTALLGPFIRRRPEPEPESEPATRDA